MWLSQFQAHRVAGCLCRPFQVFGIVLWRFFSFTSFTRTGRLRLLNMKASKNCSCPRDSYSSNKLKASVHDRLKSFTRSANDSSAVASSPSSSVPSSDCTPPSAAAGLSSSASSAWFRYCSRRTWSMPDQKGGLVCLVTESKKSTDGTSQQDTRCLHIRKGLLTNAGQAQTQFVGSVWYWRNLPGCAPFS